jgi:hypothetical protein
VVEHRAGVDDPVDVRDGQADRAAVEQPQVAGAGGSVHVDGVVDAAVAGGQHHGRAVADHAEMADQAGVEHGIEVVAVGAGAFAQPGDGAAAGGGEAHPIRMPAEVAS